MKVTHQFKSKLLKMFAGIVTLSIRQKGWMHRVDFNAAD